MSTPAALIVFCALALASLLTVSLVNRKQHRTQVMRQKLKKLKRRIEDLEDLVVMLDQLVESRAIAKLINDEMIELLRGMLTLADSATYLEAKLSDAESMSQKLSHESPHRELCRLQDSDAQIARAEYALNEAGRILQSQYARSYITVEERDTFISELAWARLQVKVISHIGQGHRIIRTGDINDAHAFYRKAQHLLIQSKHPDPRRQRMIKEVSELLNLRRHVLSQDLMPETQYNPDASSATL